MKYETTTTTTEGTQFQLLEVKLTTNAQKFTTWNLIQLALDSTRPYMDYAT